jgi:hypothetical protein
MSPLLMRLRGDGGRRKGRRRIRRRKDDCWREFPFAWFHEWLRELAGRGNGHVELLGERFCVLKDGCGHRRQRQGHCAIRKRRRTGGGRKHRRRSRQRQDGFGREERGRLRGRRRFRDIGRYWKLTVWLGECGYDSNHATQREQTGFESIHRSMRFVIGMHLFSGAPRTCRGRWPAIRSAVTD